MTDRPPESKIIERYSCRTYCIYYNMGIGDAEVRVYDNGRIECGVGKNNCPIIKSQIKTRTLEHDMKLLRSQIEEVRNRLGTTTADDYCI